MPNKPQHAGQTATINNHGLTAIDGRFHDFIWRCRTCGERRSEKLAFTDIACE